MSLKQLIIDAGSDKTAAELLAELNALSIPQTDDQLYTYLGIIDKIGQVDGFAFRATIKGLGAESNPAGLPDVLFQPINFAHERFAGNGLDLSRSDVQFLLDQLAVIPQLTAFVPAIKAIGLWSISPHVNAGNEGEVTLEEVEAALAEVLLDADKAARKVAGATAWNEWNTAIDAWDGSGDAPVLGGA